MHIHPLRTLGLSTLVAGSLALSGCGEPESAKAAAPAQLPKVVVHQVVEKPVALYSELPGRTAPYLIAEVRPQVNGIVEKRLFTEGSNVKAGASLYQIDASTYQAEVASAKASLERAQANLRSAEIRNTRFQDLAKLNAVSQQERDDTYAALQLAQADVASAKAALQKAQINLNYTRVNAPISGRIGRSSVTAGALVQQGQPQALATIQQLNPMYVDLTQSASELLALKADLASGAIQNTGKNAAKVRLKLENGQDYPHEGTLQFSEVSVDQETGSVTLRAVFPNPDLTLLPGMYVRAALEEGVRESGILVPQKGIVRDATGAPSALVVNAENKVERRSVKTARAMGNQWLVAEGLAAGDRVIIEGLQKVRPGQEVEATTAKQEQ
ncbi:efflux RND transporter periplasmic adaptor subunit [Limnobacter sp.]|uniref:efflux RND transporter periplasmic adaptor subunit n=1 Tax=Limnobacter sp. TaxID=2003368 RepID=UPI0035154A63